MTLASADRDLVADEIEPSEPGAGRGVVAAAVIGAGLWTVIISIALSLWT